jgi:hypothetical protein
MLVDTIYRCRHDNHSNAEKARGNRERGIPPAHGGQRSRGFVHNFDDSHRFLDCEHTSACLVAHHSRVRRRDLGASARGLGAPSLTEGKAGILGKCDHSSAKQCSDGPVGYDFPDRPFSLTAKYSAAMGAFLYHCPNTGFRVQGRVEDGELEDSNNAYEGVIRHACGRLLLVISTTTISSSARRIQRTRA